MKTNIKFSTEDLLDAFAKGMELKYGQGNEHEEDVAKDYINPTAATLLTIAGYPVTYQDGTILSKSSLEDYTRNNLVTGPRARNVLKLIFNEHEILKRFTWISGDERTIPIDIYRGLVEQLISTERAGAQLTAGEETDIMYVLGTELYCRHVERQWDIKVADLYNNLYRPNFKQDMEQIVTNEIANDLAKLFTNGYTDTHVKGKFYTLMIGYDEVLRNASGSWTNSNSVSIVYGKYGKYVTPQKIDVNVVVDHVVYDNAFDTSADGFTVVSGVTAAKAVNVNTSGALEVTAATTGYVKRNQPIKVHPHTYYQLAFSADGDDATSSGYVKVVNEGGNEIGRSSVHTGTTAADYTVDFYTGDSGVVNLYFYSTVNTKIVAYYDVEISKCSETLDGYDIIDVLKALKRQTLKPYRTRKDMVYLISPEDVDDYGDCRASAVYVKEGQYVGTNTTVRDMWTTDGVIPNFKGSHFVVNPVHPSLNELTPKDIANSTENKGSIIYGPLREVYIGGKNMINTYRNPTGRLRTGGAGIENTKHFYLDINVRNKMAFAIAYRGAKCETPVLMDGVKKDSSAVVSTVRTAAAGCYAYCDTWGSTIYYALTSNVAYLDTYETVQAGITAGKVFTSVDDVLISSAGNLTAAAWSFRAFKNGVCQPSTIKACTFA